MLENLCTHDKVTRGPDIPRRYGSWQSRVCTACGAWHRVSHVDEHRVDQWEPASALDAAARRDDED
jgi:hypothetical protein